MRAIHLIKLPEPSFISHLARLAADVSAGPAAPGMIFRKKIK